VVKYYLFAARLRGGLQVASEPAAKIGKSADGRPNLERFS